MTADVQLAVLHTNGAGNPVRDRRERRPGCRGASLRRRRGTGDQTPPATATIVNVALYSTSLTKFCEVREAFHAREPFYSREEFESLKPAARSTGCIRTCSPTSNA